VVLWSETGRERVRGAEVGARALMREKGDSGARVRRRRHSGCALTRRQPVSCQDRLLNGWRQCAASVARSSGQKGISCASQ
jgi:hypothetical protein